MPFVCVNAKVNALATDCAGFDVVEISSKSSNDVTATERCAISTLFSIDDKRALPIFSVRPTPPRIKHAATFPASFGLRLDQRHSRTGGETGRALTGRPSNQRSRSSASARADWERRLGWPSRQRAQIVSRSRDIFGTTERSFGASFSAA